MGNYIEVSQLWFKKKYPSDQLDHCIDHLRQMIMCNADMTPIPSRYFPGIKQNYIDSDQPHTCRNFEKLRDWVTERYNGSLAVSPRYKITYGSLPKDEWSS
jgi:hypothetical protein